MDISLETLKERLMFTRMVWKSIKNRTDVVYESTIYVRELPSESGWRNYESGGIKEITLRFKTPQWKSDKQAQP